MAVKITRNYDIILIVSSLIENIWIYVCCGFFYLKEFAGFTSQTT